MPGPPGPSGTRKTASHTGKTNRCGETEKGDCEDKKEHQPQVAAGAGGTKGRRGSPQRLEAWRRKWGLRPLRRSTSPCPLEPTAAPGRRCCRPEPHLPPPPAFLRCPCWQNHPRSGLPRTGDVCRVPAPSWSSVQTGVFEDELQELRSQPRARREPHTNGVRVEGHLYTGSFLSKDYIFRPCALDATEVVLAIPS